MLHGGVHQQDVRIGGGSDVVDDDDQIGRFVDVDRDDRRCGLECCKQVAIALPDPADSQLDRPIERVESAIIPAEVVRRLEAGSERGPLRSGERDDVRLGLVRRQIEAR
jgi:hypothetical protein